MPLVIDDEGTAKALRILAEYNRKLYANGKQDCFITLENHSILLRLESSHKDSPPSTLNAP